MNISNKKIKSGISLIVLIITIIVIIILASAVILSVTKNNPIDQANESVNEQLRASVFDAYNIECIAEMVKDIPQEVTLASIALAVGKTESELATQFRVSEGILEEKINNDWVSMVNPSSTSDKYTTIKAESKYNKPYIPEEFKYLTGTWDTGLVIQDTTNENEFVWVPCKNTKNSADCLVEYKKDFSYLSNYSPTASNTSDEVLLLAGVTNEKDQIDNYGGFYIARYESGIPETMTDAIKNANKANRNVNGKPVSKQDAVVWNYIDYAHAKLNAENMYTSSSDIKSGLVTGTAWDTTLKFIGTYGVKNTTYATNSTGKGNYNDSDSNNDPAKSGDKRYTAYKLNNIYDMAGNAWEWTTEIYISFRVNRSGGCYDSGSSYAASYRRYGVLDGANNVLSSRVLLYIL